ncbi:type II toxin -antitoxin system TacA 1-like antitoxin [Idiomarina loihiensis]|uniref:type II toxin -antitoxin system TacA 1-like antitoxin n=1 Tax=Idiomarina loihiensis TaxID=135577 RepID=UPI0014152A82|nr:DUF1778 domain-containing protein [Idiomarina loihiensis]
MKKIRIRAGQKMDKKTKSAKLKTAGQTTKLNKEAWERLNKIINEPPQPTEALKDLMKSS